MSTTPSSPAPTPREPHALSPPPPARQRRSRHRWFWRGLFLAITLPVLLWLLLTHSPITKRLILPPLSRALGLEVDAAAVRVTLAGQVVFRELTARVPGVAGPAGQFLAVPRAVAHIDWVAALRGRSDAAREVVFTEPLVIISQATTDASLNVARLATARRPAAPAPGVPAPGVPAPAATPLVLPTITLYNASIELGEHTQTSYTPLKRLTLNGQLVPDPDTPGQHSFVLRQAQTIAAVRAGPLDPSFRILGAFGPAGVTARLSNFSLADWPPSSVPSSIRNVLEELQLTGDVPTATFSFTPDAGVAAELTLRGVAMNLPVAPDPEFTALQQPIMGPPMRNLRMRSVDGTIVFARDSIAARVAGLVEDLPYKVTLRYDGTTTDSPFELEFAAENFRIDRSPALLPYAPQAVRTWLRTFSSPTAVVTARVSLSRASVIPGQKPAPLRVNGRVDLQQGTAAYDRFPYAFSNINGSFLFDNESLEIVGMVGSSPSGATLNARARISPLDDSAEVKVVVNVRNAPIDRAMAEAFGQGDSNLIDALFNSRAYQQLVAQGLIRTPRDAAAQPDASAAPVFELGGLVDIDVDIFSPRGVGLPIDTTIDIRIPRAGLVPEKFPYPIIAENVVARVLNERGELIAGNFRGLTGGRADVKASFGIPSRADTNQQPPADITISARDLPFDALGINALPTTSTGPGQTTLKRLLRDLKINARLDGTVRVANRPDHPERALGFDADLTFAGATIAPDPHPGAQPVRGVGIAGRLVASENAADLTFSGQLASPTCPQPSPISAHLVYLGSDAPGQNPSTFSASIDPLHLSIPPASLVWPFSTDAATSLHALWTRHDPGGTAKIDILATLGEPTRVKADLRPIGRITLTQDDARVELAPPQGPLDPGLLRIVQAEPRAVAEFHAITQSIKLNGQHAGTLEIDGVYPIARPSPDDQPTELRVDLDRCPVESPLVWIALSHALEAPTIERLRAMDPSGVFDAQLTIATAPPDPLLPLPASPRSTLRGVVRPRSLALTLDGSRIVLPAIGGSIDFEPGSGVLRRVRVTAPEWTIGLDGSWTAPPEGGLTLRGNLTASAARLTDDLRAILPADVRAAIDQLELQVDGPLTMEDASLILRFPPADAPLRTTFSAAILAQDVRLDVGLPISGLTGRADILLEPATQAPAELLIDIAAPTLRVSGAAVTSARASITRGPSGTITVGDLAGRVHGGRFTGHVEIPPPIQAKGPRRFDADLRLAGVRLKPLLDDINRHEKGQPPLPASDTADDPSPADLSRGVVEASLSLTGLLGDPASRRGRGEVHVARKGSRVLDIPVLLRLIEVSNLTLPSNRSLDLAQARFFVDGNLVTFEDLSAYSQSISINGFGTMTLPDRRLDLRFNSSAARPIPILSTLVEGIRNEFVTTSVTGTLDNPSITLRQFSGTRRAIGRAVGVAQSPTDQRLDDIARRTDPLTPQQARAQRRLQASPQPIRNRNNSPDAADLDPSLPSPQP